jgi:hypothetical protein
LLREFVSAFEEKAVTITNPHFAGLQRLCEGFGFFKFTVKFSKFCRPLKDSQRRQIGSSVATVRNALLSESFQFVVNGTMIEIDVAEAPAHFPTVREQLSVDGYTRKLFVNDSGIEAADIRSLKLPFQVKQYQ